MGGSNFYGSDVKYEEETTPRHYLDLHFYLILDIFPTYTLLQLHGY